MTTSLEQYQIIFNNVSDKLPGNQISWIKQLREQALAHFLQTGFPTTRDEDWRYTSLRQIDHDNIHLAADQTPSPLLDEKSHALLQKATHQNQFENLIECVFINGQWLAPGLFNANKSFPFRRHCEREAEAASEARQVRGNPVKIFETSHVKSLSECLNHHSESLIPVLNQAFNSNIHPNPFTQLNNALMQNGAFIHIPEHQTATIHLIFLTTPATTLQACHLRNLIVLDKNAKATVIESYLGDEEQPYLTNTVTEIQLGEKASLTHYKFQNEGKKAFHFGTVYVKQAKPNSQFESHIISLGGLLSRSDTHTQLDAPMTHCLLNGLYALSGNQHMDHHTSIHHLKPQGTSQEFYKGLLDGNARGVFNGKVIVSQDAQKTDSQQYNQNLLLSETAEIDTKPQLEIFADDVKCSHGATVGQLDEAALFYLRTRGIDQETARQLLIEAFFSDVIHRMSHLALREQVKQCL